MDSLFEIDEYGGYRYNDPDTSKEAALSVNATRLEELFLGVLARHPDGRTSHQVADALNIPLVSISPRTAPLVRKGKIYKAGERAGENGRMRTVWKLKEPSAQ